MFEREGERKITLHSIEGKIAVEILQQRPILQSD
jgi:hypothetical protein